MFQQKRQYPRVATSTQPLSERTPNHRASATPNHRAGATQDLTVCSLEHRIDTEARVLLGDLARLDARERLDRRLARVLGQGQRDGVQGVGERAHCVLLNARHLENGEHHRTG